MCIVLINVKDLHFPNLGIYTQFAIQDLWVRITESKNLLLKFYKMYNILYCLHCCVPSYMKTKIHTHVIYPHHLTWSANNISYFTIPPYFFFVLFSFQHVYILYSLTSLSCDDLWVWKEWDEINFLIISTSLRVPISSGS